MLRECESPVLVLFFLSFFFTPFSSASAPKWSYRDGCNGNRQTQQELITLWEENLAQITKLWFQNKGKAPVNLPTHLSFLLSLALFPASPDPWPWCGYSHGEWTTEQDILYPQFSSKILKKVERGKPKRTSKYHGDSRGGRTWESIFFHLYTNSCAHLSYMWVNLNLHSTHRLGELKDGVGHRLSPWLAACGTCRTDLNNTAKDMRTKLTRPHSK